LRKKFVKGKTCAAQSNLTYAVIFYPQSTTYFHL